MTPLCHIITPIGMVGYGLDAAELSSALRSLRASSDNPVAIICDSGSTDGGPEKLALGYTSTPRSAYVRDLSQLVAAVVEFNVPLLIGSAGGDGSNDHVDEFLEIIQELTENKAYR